MEHIGYWEFGRNVHSVVVIDGLLRLRFEPGIKNISYDDRIAFKRNFSARYFGSERFLMEVTDGFIDRVICLCIGKSEEDVVDICGWYRKKREERKAIEREKAEKWERLREKFDGVVIGIDSKIDVYETGFSVRVLFGSDVGFIGKKKFLAENRVEFMRWVIHELSESKNAMRRIGDMRFYRPVEIVNLRAQEVEVKFEIKKEVA